MHCDLVSVTKCIHSPLGLAPVCIQLFPFWLQIWDSACKFPLSHLCLASGSETVTAVKMKVEMKMIQRTLTTPLSFGSSSKVVLIQDMTLHSALNLRMCDSWDCMRASCTVWQLGLHARTRCTAWQLGLHARKLYCVTVGTACTQVVLYICSYVHGKCIFHVITVVITVYYTLKLLYDLHGVYMYFRQSCSPLCN